MLNQRKPIAGKDDTVTSGVTYGRTEPCPVGTTVSADEPVYIVAPRDRTAHTALSAFWNA